MVTMSLGMPLEVGQFDCPTHAKTTLLLPGTAAVLDHAGSGGEDSHELHGQKSFHHTCQCGNVKPGHLQVVMRRMQVQDSPGYPRIYRNTADCIRSGSHKISPSFELIKYPEHAAMLPHMIDVLHDVQTNVPKGRHKKLLEVRGSLGSLPCHPVS